MPIQRHAPEGSAHWNKRRPDYPCKATLRRTPADPRLIENHGRQPSERVRGGVVTEFESGISVSELGEAAGLRGDSAQWLRPNSSAGLPKTALAHRPISIILLDRAAVTVAPNGQAARPPPPLSSQLLLKGGEGCRMQQLRQNTRREFSHAHKRIKIECV
jgi:hypothetical protein